MSDRDAARPGAHEEAWLLLPWLANGTLAPPELETVALHLEECDACVRELERCRALFELSRPDESSAPAAHPALIERLLARDEDGSEAFDFDSPLPPAAADRGQDARRPWPRAATWLVAAQLAALALLGGWVGIRSRPEARPVSFRTLSDPAPAVDETRLRVVFDPETPEAALRQLLLDVGAEIVAGPSPLGVYSLRLRRGEGAEPPRWVVENLRARPEVRFVELVAPGGSGE